MSGNLFADKSATRTRLESSNLLKYASNSRDEGFFSDFTVNVDGLSIPASRMVLACHSKFFERMFKTNMKEKYGPDVEIQDVKGAAVKSIIDYFYTETININSNSVMDLLTASDFLLVDDVKKFCYEFLESIAAPRNAVRILKKAEAEQNKVVSEWIYQYISGHLDEVALTNDFKCLTKEEFTACLTEKTANHSEELKCRALLSWVKHDEETRRSEFAELFQQLVNLGEMSIEFHKEVLLKERLITDNTYCHQQVLTAFSTLLECKSAPFNSPTQSKVISIGGENNPQKIQDVFNAQGQALLNYPNLPREQNFYRTLIMNNFVYCFGGISGPVAIGQVSNHVWQINVKNPKPEWREIAPMREKRKSMGAAVHHENIVVAGGHCRRTLNTAEFYKIPTDEWNRIAAMKQRREEHALVSCEGVFALGGKDGNKVLSSVEILRELHREWKNVAPMQTPRFLLAAVNCKGIIYAIGGQSHIHHTTSLKTVERYHAETDAWSYVSEMKKERFGHAACVLNGKIIVVGGRGINYNHVREIECYDPSADTWSIVGAIRDGLWDHSIVSM